MNFLKKKKSKQKEEPINHQKPIVAILDMDELPDEALEITYNHLQKKYSENQNSETQQKLVLLSQVMTDRAVDGGNGHVKEYFMEKGLMTTEKWNKLSNDEKQSLAVMKDKMEKLHQSFEELTKPTPEKIEISIKATIPPPSEDLLPPQEEIDSIHSQAEELRKAEIEKKVKERVEFEVKEELKRKNIVHLDNIEVKDPLPKPKKKGLGSIFKKKIPKMIEVPSSQTKQVTPDQKERAKIMEQATIKKSKLNIFGKEKKPKLDLPDVFCPDCNHSIKAHQKKGVSTGCKCGCLQTLETIAEKHGVQLYSPKVVLNNVLVEQESITEQHKADEQIQAEKLHSMTNEANVPKPKPNQQMKPKGICVNCDHVARTHFEEKSFCTVVGCTCDEYRAYPQ